MHWAVSASGLGASGLSNRGGWQLAMGRQPSLPSCVVPPSQLLKRSSSAAPGSPLPAESPR